MSRESEVATLLRANTTLTGLVTGGVYEASRLGEEGITDPITTPDVYAGGVLKPTIVVAQRRPVPALNLFDSKRQHASAFQVVQVFAYQHAGTGDIETAMEYVYSILQGVALGGSWPCEWSDTVGPLPAPELPGSFMARQDWQSVYIRRPVAV